MTAASPASGEGGQGRPGGGGAEPAAQQPEAAGRVGECGHPLAPGLQAAGLAHHGPGLSRPLQPQPGCGPARHCSGPSGHLGPPQELSQRGGAS